MANRSSMLTAIAQSASRLQQRLYKPPQDNINNVTGDSSQWPTPLQPVQPMGPPGSEPLGFNLWMGQNLIYTPRVDSPLTAYELRNLATYPLARICIENVKDAVSSLPWRIQAIQKPGESVNDRKKREKDDPVVAKLSTFFEYPDGYNTWDSWIRPFLEDMLVIDAGTILMRRTFKNEIAELRVIDGATITQYIDDNGFVPLAPSPAFAQLWDGIPRVNLTTDQLVYRPRNIVRRNTLSSQLYGMSPTEQMAEEIRVGQERLNFVLAYYTEGSVPGLVHVAPAGVSPDRIAEVMGWMNSELAGNLARRRQWRTIQGFRDQDDAKEEQIIQLKEPVLADTFDDLHIRKIAFGYGTSAQRLLKMMNRASSESNQDAAEEEGTAPYVQYVTKTINYIIQRQMGYEGYEIAFDLAKETDPLKRSNSQKIDVDSGIVTRNEAREMRGLDPDPSPEASQLMVTTGTDVVPLSGAIIRTQQQLDAATAPKPAPNEPGKPTSGAAPEGAKKKLLKSSTRAISPVSIDSGRLTEKNARLLDDLDFRIARWLKRAGENIGAAIRHEYGGKTILKLASATRIKRLQKGHVGDPDQPDANDPDNQPELLFGGKPATPLQRHTAQALALLAASWLNWGALGNEVEQYLEAAAQEGVDIGADQLPDIMQPDSTGAINIYPVVENAELAAARYARYRSAELVGMMRLDDGSLVPNPDAKWAISETTREDLRNTIAQAIEENWTANQLAAVIEASPMFSAARATLIAQTEMANAQSLGTFLTWTQSGVALQVQWVSMDDDGVCDICDAFEDQGVVPLGHEFAPGIQHPTAHPRCRCVLEVVQGGNGTES